MFESRLTSILVTRFMLDLAEYDLWRTGGLSSSFNWFGVSDMIQLELIFCVREPYYRSASSFSIPVGAAIGGFDIIPNTPASSDLITCVGTRT